jgi:hypothetical protein
MKSTTFVITVMFMLGGAIAGAVDKRDQSWGLFLWTVSGSPPYMHLYMACASTITEIINAHRMGPPVVASVLLFLARALQHAVTWTQIWASTLQLAQQPQVPDSLFAPTRRVTVLGTSRRLQTPLAAPLHAPAVAAVESSYRAGR